MQDGRASYQAIADEVGLSRAAVRGPNPHMNTRTTIVLSTLFEKPGLVPTEPD